MKGKISTDVYLSRKTCRRGSYLSILEQAASSSALGEHSKGQQTSTRMMEELSCDMIVRSGLLAPDVPGWLALSFWSPDAPGLLAQSDPEQRCAVLAPSPNVGGSD